MKIVATRTFEKCAKSIAKKYKRFQTDYDNFVADLKKNPSLGTDLGSGLRKVRMAIQSKAKGKSGGCRVITLGIFEKNDILFLTYIYDKSDTSNISVRTLKEILKEEGLII